MTVQLRHVLETKKLIKEGVLTAPTSFTSMTDDEIRLKYNGCGPRGWERFTPQSLLGLHVCYACIIHDHEYENGKMEGERNRADDRLKDNLLSLVEYTPRIGNSLRNTIAFMVHLLLDLFGPIGFYNKDKALK